MKRAGRTLHEDALREADRLNLNPADARRSKPRLNLTFDRALRAEADRMAEERGLSLTQLLEHLVREEVKRERRRGQ